MGKPSGIAFVQVASCNTVFLHVASQECQSLLGGKSQVRNVWGRQSHGRMKPYHQPVNVLWCLAWIMQVFNNTEGVEMSKENAQPGSPFTDC